MTRLSVVSEQEDLSLRNSFRRLPAQRLAIGGAVNVRAGLFPDLVILALVTKAGVSQGARNYAALLYSYTNRRSGLAWISNKKAAALLGVRADRISIYVRELVDAQVIRTFSIRVSRARFGRTFAVFCWSPALAAAHDGGDVEPLQDYDLPGLARASAHSGFTDSGKADSVKTESAKPDTYPSEEYPQRLDPSDSNPERETRATRARGISPAFAEGLPFESGFGRFVELAQKIAPERVNLQAMRCAWAAVVRDGDTENRVFAGLQAWLDHSADWRQGPKYVQRWDAWLRDRRFDMPPRAGLDAAIGRDAARQLLSSGGGTL